MYYFTLSLVSAVAMGKAAVRMKVTFLQVISFLSLSFLIFALVSGILLSKTSFN